MGNELDLVKEEKKNIMVKMMEEKERLKAEKKVLKGKVKELSNSKFVNNTLAKAMITLTEPNFVKVHKNTFMADLISSSNYNDVTGYFVRFAIGNGGTHTFQFSEIVGNSVADPPILIDQSILLNYYSLDFPAITNNVRDVFSDSGYDKFTIGLEDDKDFFYVPKQELLNLYGNYLYFSVGYIHFGSSVNEEITEYEYLTIKIEGRIEVNPDGSWPGSASTGGGIPDAKIILALPCPPEWKANFPIPS